MKKHILILGGGIMQMPAVRAAKELGWRMTLADGNDSCVARGEADRFLHIDLRNDSDLVKAARALSPSIDAVFTAGTDFSYAVARIAEALDLPGHSTDAALNATDKHRMRRCFRDVRVPTPRFERVEPRDSEVRMRQKSEKIGFPVVVKPVDNMGARGVVKVTDTEALLPAVLRARQFSRTGMVVLEEFLDGPEYSIDALVFDGEIHITGIANRHIFFPPYFVEMGHTIPSEDSRKTVDQLTTAFKMGVGALGLSHGAAKGDVFFTDRGAVIGEIAGRLSGGFMSGWTFPNSSGIDLTRVALRLSAGLRPTADELLQKGKWWSAERALISVPGIVRSVKMDQDMDKSITNVFIKAEPGMRVNLPQNNVEKVANVITRSETREGAVLAAEEALGRIEVHLETGPEETEAYLLKEGELSDFRYFDTMDFDVFERSPYMGDVELLAEMILSERKIPYIPIESSFTNRFPGPRAETVLDLREKNGKIRPSETLGIDGIFWRTLVSGGLQGILYIEDLLLEKNTAGGLIQCIQRIERYF